MAALESLTGRCRDKLNSSKILGFRWPLAAPADAAVPLNKVPAYLLEDWLGLPRRLDVLGLRHDLAPAGVVRAQLAVWADRSVEDVASPAARNATGLGRTYAHGLHGAHQELPAYGTQFATSRTRNALTLPAVSASPPTFAWKPRNFSYFWPCGSATTATT